MIKVRDVFLVIKRKKVKVGEICARMVQDKRELLYVRYKVNYERHCIHKLKGEPGRDFYGLQDELKPLLLDAGVTIVRIEEDTGIIWESFIGGEHDAWTHKQDLGYGYQYWATRSKMRIA